MSLTPDEKKALAEKLRVHAQTYRALKDRAGSISHMVQDLLAAADELDPPEA